uniref:hypothetical protein n=1 Tax=Lutibacter sp. TaxID=1925666 RepID=UPI003567E5BC
MKNKVKKFLLLPILFMGLLLFAQEEKDPIPLSEQYIIFEGDTLLIELDEIFLLKKLKFKTD